MSKFDNDKVMPRYMAIAVVLTLVGLAVIGPVALHAKQWPVVGGGQLLPRRTIKHRQPFLAATGDDTRCVD